MLKKLQKLIKDNMYRLPTLKKFIKGSLSMKWIYFCCVIIVLPLAMFSYGCWWQFKYRGIVDLPILIEMFKATTLPQVLAFIAYLAKSLVDKDDNGESDSIEEELKMEERKLKNAENNFRRD